MSGPLGDRVPPPQPAPKPRITPVDATRGIWKDQQGRLETWRDHDGKPIDPPSADTGIEPDINFDAFILLHRNCP
jgi:hypothetical protein